MFIADGYLKPSPPLLGSAFLHPILPFFSTMQASIAFFRISTKANIINFLEMVAKYGPTSSLPYRLNPNKVKPRGLCTHSCNATQKGWSSPTVLIRCELGFCNWVTRNAQQTGVPCSAKQALFCICCGKIKLFHFCWCGSWHFWFSGETFSKDFQVVLRNLKSLIRILWLSFHQGQLSFS